MSDITAENLVFGAGLYMAIGLVVAIAFLGFGIARHDPAAKNISLPTRLLMMPGMALLWPIVIDIWMFGPRNNNTKDASEETSL